jgi:hypothetical protein
MSTQELYRVVAVRTDGSRLLISRNETLEAAKSKASLLRRGAGYMEIKVLSESTGTDLPAKLWQSPKDD